MWDDQAQPGMNPQDPNAMPAAPQPQYDPWAIEQARQEIEIAHEEFQRLLAGRPRLYSHFR